MAQNVRVPTSIRPHLLPAALAIACAVAVVWTPWPLLVLSSWSLVAALAVDGSIRYAVASAVVVWSAGALVAGFASPVVPGGLLVGGILAQAFAVVLAAGCRPNSLVESVVRLRAEALTVAAAVVIPVGLGLAVLVRSTGFSWALWNDAVVQFFVARDAIEHGGVKLGSGQPDPFVSTVLGWVMSVGRDEDSALLLKHDGGAQAVLTFVVVAVLGIVMALVVSERVPPGRPVLRAGAAIGGSLLAFSWLVAGFAVPFGFLNSLFALVILVSCWILWREAPSRPGVSVGLLAGATVVMLGTWPVLAVVPAGLAGVAAIVLRTKLLPQGRVRRVGVCIALALVAVAATVVAGPTLVRPGSVGEALVDGAFVASGPLQAAVPVVVALLVAAVGWQFAEGLRWEALGLVVLVLASASGLAWMSWQRHATDGVWWFYYPQKLAWMMGIVLVVTVASVATHLVITQSATARDRVLGPLVVVVIAVAMMMALPPTASPLVGQGYLGLGPLLPVATLVGEPGDVTSSFRAFESSEPLAQEVLEHAGLAVVSNGGGSAAGEQWVNDLVLTDRSRNVGSSLRRVMGTEPLSRPEGVCEVADMWGRPMTVLTVESDLIDQVARECPGLDVDVEVLP